MISKYSVKRPYTVLVAVVLVIVLGAVSLSKMTTDLLPDMSFQYALVITTDMGASPEQVESDVTAPIESAMATTSNIKNISSVSYNSYSVVTLEYEQNANMDSVVIEIQQSLDQVSGQWDDSIGTPMIMKVNPDMMPVLAAAVDKDGMDANALSGYVKNDLAPALESLEGVASVTTTGQLEESVDVTLDQDKIDALNKKIQKDGIKSGELIEDVIRDIMNEKGITGFENLPINLSICTVDTLTTDECIFTTKEENLENEHIHYITGAPLETAVRASMSFPAIYTTCPYDKYNFIDGGSKDNLPVKILRDMGVGKVLAIGFDIMTYNPDAGLGGLIKVIWRALDVYSIDGTRESKKMADLAIDIKNENTQLFSMDSVDETIQEGYDAIMAHKDEILKVFGEQNSAE